jgi:Xaa-Pro aminopeptidase
VDELSRRLANTRAAAERAGLDAVVVAGSEYTGFEGAVTYLSGFTIVHRYAYVLVPHEGDPAIVFPAEARYVGEHGQAQLEQVFEPHPGEWLAGRLRGQRVGVYGLDYVMTVRDYRALADAADVVPFDEEFDLARAVKSDAELESVRDSVRINTEGFRIFMERYRPGITAAEVMAECERYFVDEGCGRLTMDMVLQGPEFLLARKDLERSASPTTTAGECSRPTRSTSTPHAPRSARASAPTTSTGPSRAASMNAATTSATSPATRSA